MVLATYGWGRYLAHSFFLDLNDNFNAQAWIDNNKAKNFGAGLMMLGCARRWGLGDNTGFVDRISTYDNVLADRLSRTCQADQAKEEGWKVFDFAQKYMPGTIIVHDHTILVTVLRDMRRLLELGGQDCPTSTEAFEDLQQAVDSCQIEGALPLVLISRVGTVRYRDYRLEILAGQVAQAVTHVEVEEGDLCPDWLATGGDEVKI